MLLDASKLVKHFRSLIILSKSYSLSTKSYLLRMLVFSNFLKIPNLLSGIVEISRKKLIN